MKKEKFSLHLGESQKVLRSFDDNQFHALVTDPPAGILYKNQNWDKHDDALEKIFKECFRVLLPGAFGFVWAYPRTSHFTALALNSAGFQIKDILTHVYFNGFPKGLDLEKVNHVRMSLKLSDIYIVTEWIRSRKKSLGLRNSDIDNFCGVRGSVSHWSAKPPNKQASIPPEKRWKKLISLLGQPPSHVLRIVDQAHGLGTKSKPVDLGGRTTSLKPSHEHWILVQKPIFEKNIVQNLKAHGTGALFLNNNSRNTNLLVSGKFAPGSPYESYIDTLPGKDALFYASRSTVKEKGSYNLHPTVKPLSLMNHLVQIVTPRLGRVLDPFMGSGTTGIAVINHGGSFSGIEKSPEYFEIAKKRLQNI